MITPENIPVVLTTGERFVGWRSEPRAGQPKPAKMPYSPTAQKGASSTDPGHWVSFERAVKYANVAGLDGIMRAFDAADGLVGVDLDNCRDPETGDLVEWAAAIVKRLDTYTEVSPSGTGVKMWMYATLPPHGRKRGDVEMYDRGRFFTMTGHQLVGTPSTVGYRPDALLAVHRQTFGDAPDLTAAAVDRDGDLPALQLGDEEVLRLAAESKHNGERFRRIWAGDSSDYAVAGNDGESEADAALFEILAYYGGPDPDRIERLARRSERVREKWDRHKTYLRDSITFALGGKTRFYGDAARNVPKPVVGTDGAETCACGCPNCASEIAEYRESNRDLLERVEREKERAEDLLMRNGLLSQKLTAKAVEVERLNREMYADRRLGRCKNLTSSQRDTIRAIVRVASNRADLYDNDAPIITAETLASEIGKHESTARAAAETVCGLPGSPITKAWVPGGKYGRITTYELAVRDPVELLEQFVVVAENLEKKKSSRPQPAKCKDHPNAATLAFTRHVCSTCRKVVASTFPGESDLSAQNARIARETAERVSTRSTVVQNTRIADAPEAAEAPSVQVARLVPDPVSLPAYAATRSTGPVDGPKCGRPKRNGESCIASMYIDAGGGSRRCLGCGAVHEPLAAVAGGAE